MASIPHPSIPHPRRAIAYVQNPTSRNTTPAIFWLGLLLFGMWIVRNQQAPNGRQLLTGVLALGGIVIAGQVAHRVVFWFLLALVLASALGASPQLIALMQSIQAKGASLSLRGS